MKKKEVRGMLHKIADALNIKVTISEEMHDAYFDVLKFISKASARKGMKKLYAEWEKGWFPKPAELKKYLSSNDTACNEGAICLTCSVSGKIGSDEGEVMTHYAVRGDKATHYKEYPDGTGVCYKCRTTEKHRQGKPLTIGDRFQLKSYGLINEV
jgi:hypothetical protein